MTPTLLEAAPDLRTQQIVVNDLHSGLNETRLANIVRPSSLDELRGAIAAARAARRAVCIAGGFHSMGGQQFADDGVLIDMRSLDQVAHLDRTRGLVTVGAGIQWPGLVASLRQLQPGGDPGWGIVQKQTGADRLSLGGALSCNAHGRGLTLKPIVDQIESFDLMDDHGTIHRCSRTRNADRFRLAIGGYGLFGVITAVVLRLQRRVKVRRVVTLEQTATVMDQFDRRIRDGYLYGDFQFAIDADSDDFMRRGVFSCYQPVPDRTPLSLEPAHFDADDWARLVGYAHTDKTRAFEMYSRRYLETSGQVYWSDAQLGSPYVDHYHDHLDRDSQSGHKGSEMITEIYVPRGELSAFMEEARQDLRQRRANVIYGTVRLIERDDETFLAWARERFACVVFNLHVDHTPAAITAAAEAFRALIDLGIRHGGSYYLTYHRWARRDQVEACHPHFRAFLAAKRRHDPGELFQSNWYRHYRAMFAT
jgi:FAD/FMN-containing dehydrogenase